MILRLRLGRWRCRNAGCERRIFTERLSEVCAPYAQQTNSTKANPVKPTPESIAKGKKLYTIDCEMCHGKDGDGKGDMASRIKNVADFTNPDTLKNRTDGDLFHVIRKGKGDMPPEGDRAKNDDIWNLVNYVRSFAKK